MQIVVTNQTTIFGEIIRIFDDYDAALAWIKICLRNKVPCIVTTK